MTRNGVQIGGDDFTLQSGSLHGYCPVAPRKTHRGATQYTRPLLGERRPTGGVRQHQVERQEGQ